MGQPRGILQGTDQQLLLSADFSNAPVLDQSVGHITKRCLNGLLILREGVLALGLFKIDIRLKSPSCKDRLGDLWDETPGTARTAKKIRHRIALESKSAGKTDWRKVSFPWSPDPEGF